MRQLSQCKITLYFVGQYPKTEYIGLEDEFRFVSDAPDLRGELNEKFMHKLKNCEPNFGDGANRDSKIWTKYNASYT